MYYKNRQENEPTPLLKIKQNFLYIEEQAPPLSPRTILIRFFLSVFNYFISF